MSDQYIDYSAPHFSSYDGPLSNYHYNSNEYGNLLEFLKVVNNNDSIWLTDTLFYFHQLPPEGYDTYIICSMGEYVNEELLHKIAVKYHDRRLILLTTLSNRMPYVSAKFKIFNIEHLHTLVPFLGKSRFFPSVTNRLYTNSILTRRGTPYKTLFTALAKKYCENLIYSYDPTEVDKDEVNAVAANFDVDFEIAELFDNGNQRVDSLDQWSLLSPAYNTKFHWVNETIYPSNQRPRVYLTEKTFKAIASKTPFMIIGQQGAHNKIKQFGFRTFEHLIDSQLDLQTDFNRAKRIELAMQKVTEKFIADNVIEIQDIVDYNYEFFTTEFAARVAQLNEPNIDKLIEYLNG